MDEKNRLAAERAKAAIPRYRQREPVDEYIRRITGGTAAAASSSDDFERAVFNSLVGSARGSLGPSLAGSAGSRSRAVPEPSLAVKPGPLATTATSSLPDTGELQRQRELATTLAARLAVLEDSQRRMRDELVRKDAELIKAKAALETSNRDLEEARQRAAAAATSATAAPASMTSSMMSQELSSVRSQCAALRRQVHEMEAFLNDYGLVWVGSGTASDDDDEDDHGSGASAGVAPSAAPTEGKPGGPSYANFDLRLDFHVLAARVRELNALAGDGQRRVVTRDGVARLEEPPRVPLTVFRNGFLLWRGPFRAMSAPDSQVFMRDILDGYFPGELKASYPDGVVFELRDKSQTDYDATATTTATTTTPASESTAFAGAGRRLGSAAMSDPSAEVPTSAATGGSDTPGAVVVHSLASIGDPHLDVMSTATFLARVPDTVLRRGRVIKVRDGIADLLGAASPAERPDVVIARTPVVEGMRASSTPGSSGPAATSAAAVMSGSIGSDLGSTFRAPLSSASTGQVDDEPTVELSGADVTTLVVRSDSGRQTLLVKLRFDDTVGDLRRYIDRYRSRESPYEIWTAFPRRAYSDVSRTLREEGLVPNAKLVLRAVVAST